MSPFLRGTQDHSGIFKTGNSGPGGDRGKVVPRCPSAMSALSLPLVAALAKTSMEGAGGERTVKMAGADWLTSWSMGTGEASFEGFY